MSSDDEKEPNKQLVLVLGDQLSPDLAGLQCAEPKRDVVLMAEVSDETTYVRHHKKKIAFVLSAMRHFAEELADAGWDVDYVKLDRKGNSGSLTGEIERALKRHACDRVVITEPGEWRLLKAFEGLDVGSDISLDIVPDDRFLCSRSDFAEWAEGRKQLRMEHFYREMRRKTGLLMDGDSPEGGRWNFDSENRRPPKKDLSFAGPRRFKPDSVTKQVLKLVERRFDDHFGSLESFWFGVSREDAEAAFDQFVECSLPNFGDYQDAMLDSEPFLYHAVIAIYLNAGLLDPKTVCARVEKAYRDGDAPLNAAEGFIRQIIGWREYVRGLYWQQMPDYAGRNFFRHKRALPHFYWDADTEMACLQACISQTRDEAYAHHIQRLMVTGNFAMLAGIDPEAVSEWYLAVYADAYEWVELPNTLGMSQFADGGLLASKPYAASGNYINKMSDYCASCRYKVKEKTGRDACPFNYLYWHFLDRHRDKLEDNARLGPVYRTWDRMDRDRKAEIKRDTKRFLSALTVGRKL